MDMGKYLLNGIGSHGAFPENILLARPGRQLYTSQPGSLLSPVVLFFHQQVKFVQGIEVGAVFLTVIRQRFEQPYHGNATLVFQRFGHLFLFFYNIRKCNGFYNESV